MGVEGRLTIDLQRSPDGKGQARIASSRPLGIAQAFRGKSVDTALSTVPLLFSVCGLAQGTAAVEAAEQALGRPATDAARQARALLVLAEAAREHLIRTVIEWAAMLGQSQEQALTLRVMRIYEALRKAIDTERRALSIGAAPVLDKTAMAAAFSALQAAIENLVLGEPLDCFGTRSTAADFEDWFRKGQTVPQQLVALVAERGWSGAGNSVPHFLPTLADDELAARLLDRESDGFTRWPTWNGSPQETSVLGRQTAHPLVHDLTRHYGHGLLPRLAARIVELQELPGRMHAIAMGGAAHPDAHGATGIRASSPATGRGIAHIEAARGRLIHGIDIERGSVAHYAIVAPTEWNFHPAGSGREALAGIAERGSEAREVAELFVSTLDPCVACDVRVH